MKKQIITWISLALVGICSCNSSCAPTPQTPTAQSYKPNSKRVKPDEGLCAVDSKTVVTKSHTGMFSTQETAGSTPLSIDGKFRSREVDAKGECKRFASNATATIK